VGAGVEPHASDGSAACDPGALPDRPPHDEFDEPKPTGSGGTCDRSSDRLVIRVAVVTKRTEDESSAQLDESSGQRTFVVGDRSVRKSQPHQFDAVRDAEAVQCVGPFLVAPGDELCLRAGRLLAKRQLAIGNRDNADSVAASNQPSHDAAHPEHFVVRVRGDHNDVHHLASHGQSRFTTP
jgi:hypothetical protein